MSADEEAYSYKVNVGHVATNPLKLTFSADEAERARIAEIWNVPSVEAFSGSAAVSRWKRDGVRVKGHVDATLTQACVVSLEPVTQEISEDFEALFVPENSKLARLDLDGGELVVDPESADAPETFSGDSIDLGATAAEFAALAIDPYPRKPGAAFDGYTESTPEDDKPESPFAVLKFRKPDDPGSSA